MYTIEFQLIQSSETNIQELMTMAFEGDSNPSIEKETCDSKLGEKDQVFGTDMLFKGVGLEQGG